METGSSSSSRTDEPMTMTGAAASVSRKLLRRASDESYGKLMSNFTCVWEGNK